MTETIKSKQTIAALIADMMPQIWSGTLYSAHYDKWHNVHDVCAAFRHTCPSKWQDHAGNVWITYRFSDKSYLTTNRTGNMISETGTLVPD